MHSVRFLAGNVYEEKSGYVQLNDEQFEYFRYRQDLPDIMVHVIDSSRDEWDQGVLPTSFEFIREDYGSNDDGSRVRYAEALKKYLDEYNYTKLNLDQRLKNLSHSSYTSNDKKSTQIKKIKDFFDGIKDENDKDDILHSIQNEIINMYDYEEPEVLPYLDDYNNDEVINKIYEFTSTLF